MTQPILKPLSPRTCVMGPSPNVAIDIENYDHVIVNVAEHVDITTKGSIEHMALSGEPPLLLWVTLRNQKKHPQDRPKTYGLYWNYSKFGVITYGQDLGPPLLPTEIKPNQVIDLGFQHNGRTNGCWILIAAMIS